MTKDTAWTKLEMAIAAAAADHGRRLTTGERRYPSALDVNVLLAVIAPDFQPALAGRMSDRLIEDDRRSDILRRLAAEASRQARFARAGNPRYDLDRHIAVRRAIASLGRPNPSALAEPARPSNSALRRPCGQKDAARR